MGYESMARPPFWLSSSSYLIHQHLSLSLSLCVQVFTTIGWIASIVLGSSNLASLICGNRQPLGEGASSPSSRCREQWCCQVSRERRRGAQAALLAG
ncbi:hypothetical protein PS1_032558 [Malus domestica]